MAPHPDKHQWETRYREKETSSPTAAEVLCRYRHLLPKYGTALDFAAGLGGNALLLARHGLNTSAWDFSLNAMQALERRAKEADLPIHCEVRDVIASPPAPSTFNVIIVSRFLERSLCPAIARALKPGGLLFYQTFLRDKATPETGPKNPAYLLAQNELLALFSDLILRAYHEEGTIGDLHQGIRNEALLVAQQPLL